VRYIWRYPIQNELLFEFIACGNRTPLIRNESVTENRGESLALQHGEDVNELLADIVLDLVKIV